MKEKAQQNGKEGYHVGSESGENAFQSEISALQRSDGISLPFGVSKEHISIGDIIVDNSLNIVYNKDVKRLQFNGVTLTTKSSKAEAEGIREFIVDHVSANPRDITKLVSERFKISRQAAHRYVKGLVEDGTLTATGNTRNMRYGLKPLAREVFKLTIDKNLKEDEVWRIRSLPLFKGQTANVLRICEYGFSEILNNAADHSEGSTVRIEITIGRDLIEMMIADNGVGIFKKIQDQFHLEDPRVAVLELTKGKLTTDPKRHTGEGIFFVSRAFDGFIIQSGTLSFSHSEPDGDWICDEQSQLKGTSVTMQINPNSDRTIQNVFERFASTDQNYSFVLTQVPVALARIGSENLISRSQAKRLLARFEKFEEVSLDFKGIELIGQAFADEVFRVFAQEHPQVELRWVNANKDVEKMIRRAQAAG